ncbi:ABC transporter ATP-binding protein [Streptomyces sp. NBC_01267]|uniref:ABC transporter ATP-binding protein n=1 Tax=unclassified Streptomyces TaxID=2593676 RepID=UPI002DDB2E2A|nr:MULTISPECIES: ABC transporter ATP-binding protein [unclassified Streptomyces]WSC24695.1 ABC transporter ATP-binding protein [Streptomyces sp. NBC_01766]
MDIEELSHAIGERTLFEGLSLSLHSGESVAVTGPSGSGKSTLLSCVLGLIKPDRGSVRVTGTDITQLRSSQLARVRAQSIGMVFQFGELLPELSPVDNVVLASLLARGKRTDRRGRAASLLEDLGVPAARTSQELSGGERQRTAVARALINEPALVLADEPTGALDAETRDRTADLLFALPRRYACGLLVVTHDPAIAARADKTLHLTAGVLQNTTSQAGI